MNDSIKSYLASIEQALKAGNATEHTHRPALKTLLEALGGNEVRATNEPRQIECGAPDFIVTRGLVPLGYVEAKDVRFDLGKAERNEQPGRYRESLGNLVLTDYLEFAPAAKTRWCTSTRPSSLPRTRTLHLQAEIYAAIAAAGGWPLQ